MRETKVTRSLECKLTPEELKDCAKKLAEAILQKARIEGSLESFKAQKKAEIQSCDGEINLMSEKVNSEKEYRYIECAIEYDFEAGMKSYRRNDTKEVIQSAEITESERQEELNLQKDKEKEAEKEPVPAGKASGKKK